MVSITVGFCGIGEIFPWLGAVLVSFHPSYEWQHWESCHGQLYALEYVIISFEVVVHGSFQVIFPIDVISDTLVVKDKSDIVIVRAFVGSGMSLEESFDVGNCGSKESSGFGMVGVYLNVDGNIWHVTSKCSS